MKSLIRILLWAMLLSAPLQADQQGTIVREAMVHADASSSAQRVGKLDAGTRVSLFQRKGGWREVFSEEKAIIGWVHVYQVRQGDIGGSVVTESSEDSRGFLSGLAAFSRKASGFFTRGTDVNSSGTATIGVRGLSDAEIKSAQADFDELARMKKYASSSKRARKFASNGGLKPAKVAHISGAKQ